MSHAVRTPYPFVQFLSTGGDASGTVNQAGDYSVTPGLFYAQAHLAANEILLVHQLVIVIADNGTFNLNDYGAITNGLANGIEIVQSINGVESDFLGHADTGTSGLRPKHNFEWLSFADAVLTSFASGDYALRVKLDLAGATGTPYQLNGGDYLGMRVSDNLSALVSQLGCIYGTLVNTA
jgi:hypothetical protein